MKNIFTLLFLTVSTIYSQTFSNGFNFYLPSSDTSTQNFLPKFPLKAIGANDFVSINTNGKFSVNGNRIRFWGTNCAADEALPAKNIAGLISGRLRKFGFNLIRMHHLDNPWSSKSLVGTVETRSINLQNLDYLEYFISKLKENGVYINMNLHVSRTYRIFDQVPDYDSIPEMGKVINYFNPWILQLHKEYAQQLLTHVNPYTGKALVNDPVMAMVEITNENSLIRTWRSNQLKPIKNGGILPYRYSRELDSLWIVFLKNKYQTTTALQKAWNVGMISAGQSEQIVNGNFEKPNSRNYWGLEEHNGADADTLRDLTAGYKSNSCFKVDVKVGTGTEWHIQYKQATLKLYKDSSYTVTFALKADGVHNFNVSMMNDQSPYNGYGGKNFISSTSWQICTFSVKVNEDNVGHGRLTFQLGKEKGSYWIDDISVTRAGVAGLKSTETLDAKNIVRLDYADCPSYSNPRVKDQSEFYITLQRNFFKEMLSYLKNTLGVKVPIVTTNWTIGPADLSSMSDGDYVDNHAYWDHPQFPNVPWSSTDWLINNTPMLKDKNGGTIANLMTGVPITGKPFTVSEYNEPAPNQFQVESVMFTTGYSSFYDADAMMYFAYDESSQFDKDMVNGYFGVNRNSIYMSFFPSAAYAFRYGYIKSSINPVNISYSADTLYSLPKYDGADWTGPSMVNKKLGLINAVKTEKYFAPSTSSLNNYQSAPVSPYITDTKEITWNDNDGTIVIDAEKFIGAAGYLNKLVNAKLSSASVTEFSQSDFGAFSWISLVDKPLTKSEKSLITLGSKTQNSGMIWNSAGTTVNNNWGKSPTIIYPLRLTLDLQIFADSIRVYPLDNKGREGVYSPFTIKPASANHFIIKLDQYSNSTLWFGIEKFGNGNPSDVINENIIPTETRLNQNYPNPFNPETVISYQISAISHVTLKVYDMLGREMKTLVDDVKQSGFYNSSFHTLHSSLSSGIYFYKLQADPMTGSGRSYTAVKKMMLVK